MYPGIVQKGHTLFLAIPALCLGKGLAQFFFCGCVCVVVPFEIHARLSPRIGVFRGEFHSVFVESPITIYTRHSSRIRVWYRGKKFQVSLFENSLPGAVICQQMKYLFFFASGSFVVAYFIQYILQMWQVMGTQACFLNELCISHLIPLVC